MEIDNIENLEKDINNNLANKNKKQRLCFSIDEGIDGNTDKINFCNDFTIENEDRVSIWKSKLWEASNYQEPNIINLSQEEQKLFQNTSNNSNLSFSLLNNSPSVVISQELNKAYMEFSHLLTLTSLLHKKETISLQSVYRESESQKGIPLPPNQLIASRKKHFVNAEGILSQGVLDARLAIDQRQLFAKGILILRKNWRLILLNQNVSSKLLKNDSIDSLTDGVGIDCSYSTAGDRNSNTMQYIVPLLIGNNGPILPKSELERDSSTLSFSIRLKNYSINKNGLILDDFIIASTTAWNTLVDKSNMDLYSNSSTNLKTNIDIIHQHLLRRQHESFSNRLFSLLKSDASNFHNRWIVSETRQDIPVDLISTYYKHIFDDKIDPSIEITSIERREIRLTLSEKYELIIKLCPITTLNNNINNSSNKLKNKYELILKHCIIASEKLLLKYFQNNGSLYNKQSLVPRNKFGSNFNKPVIKQTTNESKTSEIDEINSNILKNILNILRLRLNSSRIDATLLDISKSLTNIGLDSLKITKMNKLSSNNSNTSKDSSIDLSSIDYIISHSSCIMTVSCYDNNYVIHSINNTINHEQIDTNNYMNKSQISFNTSFEIGNAVTTILFSSIARYLYIVINYYYLFYIYINYYRKYLHQLTYQIGLSLKINGNTSYQFISISGNIVAECWISIYISDNSINKDKESNTSDRFNSFFSNLNGIGMKKKNTIDISPLVHIQFINSDMHKNIIRNISDKIESSKFNKEIHSIDNNQYNEISPLSIALDRNSQDINQFLTNSLVNCISQIS